MNEHAAGAADGVPEGHHATLHIAWHSGSGILGRLSAVNHKQVGLRFIFTGLVFLVLGGILALLMRTQLLVPENDLLGPEGFAEAFTMHGTTMMFLFAVPILEGIAMYLMPLMLGTRDAPFPRLNAFGYWAYLLGGLLVFSSFLFGDAPSEGWFAYVPLSGPEFSTGSGMDFWLLGITFVEISAIVGAIELLVLFVCRRAPGMTLDRIPIFAWAGAVMSGMILLAFPSLVVGSIMLEAERALGTRFFDPGAGGDPLVWQHLFWFFGHPEVYIMFIPAVGIVSTVIPVFARRPLAGYVWVVAALVAIGLLSFGLWVHHMFTTGLSLVGLSIFAAISFVIAIPSGIQIFAWLATLWRGRPWFGVPLLFIGGFLFTFVLGGITGVMVAAVPFDWQVHDTYFVVAHFHYVLIGGVLFPIFAGLHYWFPKWSGKMISETLGRWSFWLMFAGFNLAFFPQHILGFQGMPRRVQTYREIDGWATLNLISSIGGYVIAIGVGVTLVAMYLALRRGRDAGPNPWGAGSLEWATESPPPAYNFRHMPVVTGADPLWREEVDAGKAGDPSEPAGDAELARVVEELAQPGEHLREVFETRAGDARPFAVAHLPGPSLWPLFTAIAVLIALIGGLATEPWMIACGLGLAGALGVSWALDTVAEPSEVGVERSLPIRHAGAGWWGALFGFLPYAAALGALAFGYLMLATGADAGAWPPAGHETPGVVGAAVTVAAALAGFFLARMALGGSADAGRIARYLGLSAIATAGSLAVLVAWISGLGLDASADAYSSAVIALATFAALGGTLGLVASLVVAWQALGGGRGEEPPWVSTRVVGALCGYYAIASIVAVGIVLLAPQLA